MALLPCTCRLLEEVACSPELFIGAIQGPCLQHRDCVGVDTVLDRSDRAMEQMMFHCLKRQNRRHETS